MVPKLFENDPKIIPRPPPHPWLGKNKMTPATRQKTNRKNTLGCDFHVYKNKKKQRKTIKYNIREHTY